MKILIMILILTNLSAVIATEYKTTQVSPSIYMLGGEGGNITVFTGKDGTILVDDDFAPMHEKLVLKLSELGASLPKFIINTHFHYDHTGGNALFLGATFIAAESVRTRLSSEQILWGQKHPAVLDGLPNFTFKNSLNIFLNAEEVNIQHYASGHTDGDTVVFFKKNKVLSMGDLYFSGMYPIFHPEHRGNLAVYLKNIDGIISKIPDGTTVIPGHGPMSNKPELQEYSEMIKSSIKTVNDGVSKRWSLDKIILQGLEPKWEKYGHGYRTTAQWITSIYKELK